ncbi:hypothetical protein BC828DRAFT_17143 [Blastocladiella britannica]|nr:hypothetical protein BC828DRAFT_17143 [Blastocladiella britannica]
MGSRFWPLPPPRTMHCPQQKLLDQQQRHRRRLGRARPKLLLLLCPRATMTGKMSPTLASVESGSWSRSSGSETHKRSAASPCFSRSPKGLPCVLGRPHLGFPRPASATHFPTVTLAALIDPVFNTTSLATLLLHPGDPSRVTLTPLAPTSVKFHLSVGTAAFPSFVQQHVTLRSGVLQLTALVTAMDLAHPPALVPSAIACRVLGTSAAIPGHESGHPVLAVQCIDSTDAFLSSMMALGMDRRKPSMPAFPEAEFAGAGHPVAGWPPPTMAHASSKYLVASNSAANRGLGAGNPARWDMAVVLPGTAHSTTGASALAFLVYVLAGGPTAAAAGGGGDAHEYALVAYGVLPFADAPAVPSPMAETVSHVRMYAMPGVRGKSRGNKVTLGVQVRQGPNVAGGAGRRPLAIEDALVTMPVLEPPRQDALMDEFQDIARSIMALRVEKRRLEHDHARLEKLVAGHVDPISPPPANIHSMPREELLGLCGKSFFF